MDGFTSPYLIKQHYSKVNKLGIVAGAVVAVANVIYALVYDSYHIAMTRLIIGSLIVFASCLICFLPVRRVRKAGLLMGLAATSAILVTAVFGYTTNKHYIIFLIILICTLYLNKNLILGLGLLINVGFIAIFVLMPDKIVNDQGNSASNFFRILIINNAACLISYGVIQWINSVLKKLMQSNANLVHTNRSLRASEARISSNLAELAESEEKFRMLFEEIAEGVVLFDATGSIIRCNKAWRQICGLLDEDIVGRKIWDLMFEIIPHHLKTSDLHERIRRRCEYILDGTADFSPIPSDEFEIIRRDGCIRIVVQKAFEIKTHDGRQIGSVVSDITDQREQERRIYDLAYLDIVTGLPNRARFFEELASRLERLDSDRSGGTLFIMNIDRLKVINDIFGHQFGDTLLREITVLLRSVAEDCFIARLTGGEFAIICQGAVSCDQASKRAEAILKALDRAFEVEGHKIHLSANIGIAIFPDAGITVGEVMKNADAALNKSRDNGRNTYLIFDRAITAAFAEYVAIENGLHGAVSAGEFRLYYQPQIDLRTGRICGLEALIRWESPMHGTVHPGKFIRIAEESGLIVPIGLWVIDEACIFSQALARKGITDCGVSVNISTLQIMQSDFVEKVHSIIDNYSIDRSALGFEITESAFMQSFESNVEKLDNIKRSGISIHLDDFGTGYSSLSYLKRLPIDVVKIDKSFVDDVSAEGVGKNLTKPIVGLAHTIGLKVIAEGVENMDQLRELSQYECDMVQGYYISKPIPHDEVEAFLAGYSFILSN